MKKRFNWVGFLVTSTLIIVFIVLLFFTIKLITNAQEDDMGLATVLLLGTIFGAIFSPVVIIRTLRRTSKKITLGSLPVKQEQAKIIQKHCGNQSENTWSRFADIIQVYTVTFELVSGVRIPFNVSGTLFNTVLENEEGILTYKYGSGYAVFINFQLIKNL